MTLTRRHPTNQNTSVNVLCSYLAVYSVVRHLDNSLWLLFVLLTKKKKFLPKLNVWSGEFSHFQQRILGKVLVITGFAPLVLTLSETSKSYVYLTTNIRIPVTPIYFSWSLQIKTNYKHWVWTTLFRCSAPEQKSSVAVGYLQKQVKTHEEKQKEILEDIKKKQERLGQLNVSFIYCYTFALMKHNLKCLWNEN